MKKLPTPTVLKFKMPRLYLDDVLEIENVIFQYLRPKEYEIIADGYSYEKGTEIVEDGKVIKDFRIKVFPPYVTITLDDYEARIYYG